jgi:hypothetical protein
MTVRIVDISPPHKRGVAMLVDVCAAGCLVFVKRKLS